MKQKSDRVAEIEVTYKPSLANKPIIKCPLDAFTEFWEFFPEGTIGLHERFLVMYLNRASRALGIYEVSKGGLTGTVVDLRLILSVGLKVAATSIILCHNHPSGNLQPSVNDQEITWNIAEACKLLDIKLKDHIIISPERQFNSMADAGII